MDLTSPKVHEINLVRCSAVLPQICSEIKKDPDKSQLLVLINPEVLALVEEICKLRLKENDTKIRKQKAEIHSTTRDQWHQLTALLKNKGREQLMARVEEIEAVREER